MSTFNSKKEKFAKREIKLIKKEKRREGKKMNKQQKTERDAKKNTFLASVCKMDCSWENFVKLDLRFT
jgi:hypothetical protein